VVNHYIALLDRKMEVIVSLPPKDVFIINGVIGGLTGASLIWNGAPPIWCSRIVEIRSEKPYKDIPEEDKKVLWRRRIGTWRWVNQDDIKASILGIMSKIEKNPGLLNTPIILNTLTKLFKEDILDNIAKKQGRCLVCGNKLVGGDCGQCITNRP